MSAPVANLPTLDETAPDAALVRRWLGGDERVARTIVERHADALTRFARSIGAKRDVDELVQDTFVRAFGALDTFRHDASLRTWLFTILRRLHIDRQRSERRQPTSAILADDLLEQDVVTSYDALDSMVAMETEQRVHEALARLTTMQREVFTLRVQEGRGYKDIADILGSTEGAARVHYHNAVRSITAFLRDDVVHADPGHPGADHD